jgi:uncharacterized protein
MEHRNASGLHLLVSGAGGLIGSALLSRLTGEGHRVTRLTRRAVGPGEVSWDPGGGGLDLRRLEPLDGVIHLAGENIAQHWTRARKTRIRESRVHGTRILAEALARLDPPPRVLLSASAVGIYGDRGDEILTESSTAGDPRGDFLVAVCLDWEAAAEPARQAGIRVAHPRFGVVLSPHGGALAKLLLPFRLGLGGRQGSGAQWMSWIAINDVVGIILWLLTEQRMSGPVNVTAPNPVVNRDFMQCLGRVLRRPTPFALPAAGLRLALGEMGQRTLLASARVHPAKLLDAGYRFEHPILEGALRSVLGADPRSSFPG